MTPEPDAPTKPSENPESQSMRVGNATLRVSRQSVGITLQTSTLLALLGIGWQAKNGLDEQLAQTERTRIELEKRYDLVSRSIDELDSKVQAAAATAQQLGQVQIEIATLRNASTLADRRIEDMRSAMAITDRRIEDLGRLVDRLRNGSAP